MVGDFLLSIKLVNNNKVKCYHCNNTKTLQDWQSVGWRNVTINPPHFK